MSKQFVYNLSGHSGSFESSSNWSGDVAPRASDDALIGANGMATSSVNETVNSIATLASSTLTVQNDSTFTAKDGTVTASGDTSVVASGNQGAIDVLTGSTLAIGDTFYNPGALEIGDAPSPYGTTAYLDCLGVVTLTGGGVVILGGMTAGVNSTTGYIEGGTLDNEGNEILIEGGATIGVSVFDNVSGLVVVNYDADLTLTGPTVLNSGDIINHGTMAFGTNATISLVNNGLIFEEQNTFTFLQGGVVTLTGTGVVDFIGGSWLDATASSTFVNESTLEFAGNYDRIGEAGNLKLDNYGSILTTGEGAELDLYPSVGAGPDNDGGGLIEAENSGTINLYGDVTTGQYAFFKPGGGGYIPPGGTIEAATGGVVNIQASVTSGLLPGYAGVTGKLVVESSGVITVELNGAVSVPVDVYGASASAKGGVLNVDNGSAVNGTVTFESAGATLNLDDSVGTVNLDGSFGTIGMSSANVAVTGGSDVFIFDTTVGNSTIGGFNVSNDLIEFATSLVPNWQKVQGDISHVDGNTVITLDQTDKLTILGVTDLTAKNFTFI